MKPRIIRINDISEINPAQASVYDFNNRYIDDFGNMYGLKYNRLTRQIEIVKLMRTHSSEAGLVEQQIRIEREEPSSFPESDTGYVEDPYQELSETMQNPTDAINSTLDLMKIHKERIHGIMMNIEHSNLFPKNHKADGFELDDIFRAIDIDCIQQFDKIEGYERELKNYPRSISYYHAKMDDRGRRVLDQLAGDKVKQLNFIYLYEIFHSLREVYGLTHKQTRRLAEFIDTRHGDENAITVTPHHKQAFHDAQISINNTLEEINNVLDNLAMMEDYICDPSHL